MRSLTLIGSHHPAREAWVIHVYRAVFTATDPATTYALEHQWTPDSPGPLAETWAFTHGPLHECRYGELGLHTDPGWPPDTRVLVVWEQPNTALPPDFIGAAGLVRGARGPEGGKYTLPLTGLGDVDARGAAGHYTAVTPWVQAALTAYGVTLLPPKKGETVEAHLARVLEPFPDGGWGVRPDGVRVVGRPLAGTPVTLPASEVLELQGSGYERQEYVTEALADPGERWAALTQERPRPTSITPRVMAAAGTDNLILPDLEQAPAVNFLRTARGPLGGPPGEQFTYTNADVEAMEAQPFGFRYWNLDMYLPDQAAEYSGNDPPPAPVAVRISAVVSLPLSDLVRQSASSRFAQNAVRSLRRLFFPFQAWTFGTGNVELAYPPPARYTVIEDTAKAVQANVYFRDWLSATPDGPYENAVEPLTTGTRPLTGDLVTDVREFRIPVPEDLVSEVYQSRNGGQYHYLLETWIELRARRLVAKKNPASTVTADPLYLARYDISGRAVLSVGVPRMLVDTLRATIPGDNLPPGWDAPTYSPPTFQGKVPGRLIAPAKVTGLRFPDGSLNDQFVSELRRERTADSYHTVVQIGARQTRSLTKAEKELRIAQEGGAW